MKLRLAIVFILALLVGGLGASIANNRNRLQIINISNSPGVSFSVFKDRGGDGASNYQAGDKITSFIGAAKLKLPVGTYDFVLYNDTQKYEDLSVKKTVAYGVNVVTLQPALKQELLAKELVSLKSKIVSDLSASHPNMFKNYRLTNEGLFGVADWYGFRLDPNDPSLDTLRLIAHKGADGKWSLATTPNITIGESSNTNIPVSYIDAVDNY